LRCNTQKPCYAPLREVSPSSFLTIWSDTPT
jgi:hypothetical protein